MTLRRRTDPKIGKHTFCKPAQSKGTWTGYKSHFVWKFAGKMPDANPATHVLCKPAQSKRTWIFHKSHSVWKFSGKMPDAYENTSIKDRALTVPVRTPVWGTMSSRNPGVTLQTQKNDDNTGLGTQLCYGSLEISQPGLLLLQPPSPRPCTPHSWVLWSQQSHSKR